MISWVEIPALDFHRSVDFYKTVLKTDLQIFDFDTEKMACFPSGDGAISFAPDFLPSKNGTLVSLNAGNDIDGAIQRVIENGGELITPKTKIQSENLAYFAVFIDSEGNKVGLYGE